MTDLAARPADAVSDPDQVRVAEAARTLVADHPPATTAPEEFLGAQFDTGLAWVHFDEGHGGLGVRPELQRVVQEALRGTGAPNPMARNPIGHGMGAPTVHAHGSAAQRERYLRPLFTGEEVWCQMFSEPGAGSDVASLATKAERDGDEWVVNGQKVWTTLAHLSRWGMLVARTHPDQPKHKGLTYFVVDMHAPGVEVRPLYQITGEAEFNEVYFTDVRIPDSERLGEVGEGWRVAITTLMNERVSIGGGIPAKGTGVVELAVKAWRDAGSPGGPARDELVRLWTRSEVLRLTSWRASQTRVAGTPGPEGSIGKLAMAELNKAITEFAVGVSGPQGMLLPGGYPMARPERTLDLSTVQKAFLRCRANSIEGGTTEIMKNILGERVLGLPGDVRVDKDKPWTDVPR
ncbi:MAG TPA: acyl-CoA dehydrogenase family protein [Acidimicrobiales bacterium]|nr:acyl-CoA dehydrogenase family protein [Acidimicrobiales bacterium]